MTTLRINDQLEQLAAFGSLDTAQLADDPAFSDRQEAKKVVSFTAENIAKLDGLLSELSVKASELEDSRDFTQQGREKELARLGQAFSKSLDELNIDQFLTAARSKLRAETDLLNESRSAEPLSLQDRIAVARELRESGLDGLELVGVIESAIDAGDDALADATLNLPPYIRPLDNETSERLRDKWNTARNPRQAKVVSAMRAAIQQLEARQRATCNELFARTKTNDPLEAISAGAATA